MKTSQERIRNLILFGYLFAQTACVSLSNMQTAETLPPDKGQVTVGGGNYSSKAFNAAFNKSTLQSDLTLPYLEVSYRRGWLENVDWGAKLTLIGSLSADIKYQFYKGDRFDAAVGGGLGYLSIETDNGSQKSKNTMIDVMVPVYLSYRVNDMLTPYLAPRLTERVISGSDSGSAALGGGAVGLKIGSDQGAYIEYAFQKSFGGDFTASQINVAWFWDK